MTTSTTELKDRIAKLLGNKFRISNFEMSQGEPGHLVVKMVSPDFDGLEDVDRQVRVWDLLRSELTEEELLALEYIFTEGEHDN